MYRIQLQQFEGPMDLLLFFIKRDELDIYDIPIAQIADEYLAYVRLLEDIDLDGVGDFIYMAALLINIKARMLLPSQEVDEDGEPIDPRQELVERLMEYVRFKEAADDLETARERRAEHFTRGDAAAMRERISDNHDVEVEATVYDLVAALGRVLAKEPDEPDPRHEVEPLPHSVEEQQRYVLDRLQEGTPVPFDVLVHEQSKAFVIATFLAVLELTRQQYLRIVLDPSRLHFEVVRTDDAAPAALNGADASSPPTNGAA